jgi:hypothetical protein
MQLYSKHYEWHFKENVAEEGAGASEESAGVMKRFFLKTVICNHCRR